MEKPASELKVAYTPTAANVEEHPWFIDEDRKQLREAGISFTEFNLKDIPDGGAGNYFAKMLSDIDVLIVSGGNTFYLLQETLRTNFDKVVKEFVAKGVWYVGSSAGAVLAGTTLDPITPMDDPKDAPELRTYAALKLVDFVIIPHFGDGHFRQSSQDAEEICKEKNYTYVAITNKQSVLVSGDKWNIIERK